MFSLKPSRFHVLLIVTLSLAGFVILLRMPWLAYVKALSIILLLAYTSELLYRHVLLRGAHSIVKIEYLQENSFLLYTKHTFYEAHLRADTTVTFFVAILRFNVPHKHWPITCTIFEDSLPKDRYRQLIKIVKLIPLGS